MLTGRLSDLDSHKGMLPRAVFRALEVVRHVNPNTAAGRFPMEGDSLYYTLQEVPARTEQESRPEIHRSYADIHLPLNACERFGFALPQAGLALLEDAMESRDIAFYATPPNEAFLTLEPGDYLFFLPGELHRPCLVTPEVPKGQIIRKIVVKIHRRLLGLEDKKQ